MSKPIKKFKAGSVELNIWHNEALVDKPETGMTKSDWYSVTMQRSYRDAEGNWKKTSSWRLDDLPKATLVLTKAFEFLTLKEDNETLIKLPVEYQKDISKMSDDEKDELKKIGIDVNTLPAYE